MENGVARENAMDSTLWTMEVWRLHRKHTVHQWTSSSSSIFRVHCSQQLKIATNGIAFENQKR